MFRHARIGMVITDSQGRLLEANPAFSAMLGYEEHELLGRSFTEFTHPDERDGNLRLMAEMRAGTRSGFDLEKRYVARDGSVIWAQVNVSLTREPDSGAGFAIAQVQDISARKRAEHAAAEERQLLRALLETTTDQIYFKDRDSRFLRVSNAQAAKLGLRAPEDAIGKTDFDVFSHEHASEAFADEQRILETGEPITGLEERESWTDGREAWVSTSKFPLHDERGDVIGTFGISRDITRRRHDEAIIRDSEERWRVLLANAQEMIAVVDDAGRVSYCSPSVRRWLGYDPEELRRLPSHPRTRRPSRGASPTSHRAARSGSITGCATATAPGTRSSRRSSACATTRSSAAS
jgi:PAS domain S-box-containing protein